MEVKVISSEMIRPSRPTPPNLRRHRLSFIDQMDAPVAIPIIFFFTAVGDAVDPNMRASILKRSLSEALTLFYPLAGSVVSNLFVNCNDRGIPFVETRVSCNMSDIIENSVCSTMEQLMPINLRKQMDGLAAMQFNVFSCGGMAIGTCVSHKVADGSSMCEFIKSWATICRGGGLQKVDLDSVTLCLAADQFFPQMNPVELDLNREPIQTVVTKRFVFRNPSIADIRGRYHPDLRLSRVETLMEFLLQRHFETMLKISGNKDSLKYMVSYVINLRSRIMPPLMVKAFGNMVSSFHFQLDMSRSTAGNGECKVAPHVKRATSGQFITDHLKRFQDRESQLGYLKERYDRLNDMSRGDEPKIPIFFASQSRFPIYDIDFGWGNPEWVATAGSIRLNHVLILDCKDLKGLEVFIALKDEVMALFEKDEEILAYTESTSANSSRQRPRM